MGSRRIRRSFSRGRPRRRTHRLCIDRIGAWSEFSLERTGKNLHKLIQMKTGMIKAGIHPELAACRGVLQLPLQIIVRIIEPVVPPEHLFPYEYRGCPERPACSSFRGLLPEPVFYILLPYARYKPLRVDSYAAESFLEHVVLAQVPSLCPVEPEHLMVIFGQFTLFRGGESPPHCLYSVERENSGEFKFGAVVSRRILRVLLYICKFIFDLYSRFHACVIEEPAQQKWLPFEIGPVVLAYFLYPG